MLLTLYRSKFFGISIEYSRDSLSNTRMISTIYYLDTLSASQQCVFQREISAHLLFFAMKLLVLLCLSSFASFIVL